MGPNNAIQSAVTYHNWFIWLIPIIASAIGGLIGGMLALIGVRHAYNLESKKQKIIEEQNLQNLYRALLLEFSNIWKSYIDFGPGIHLEKLKEGKALIDDFGAIRDHFTIYTSNSNMIGRIPDKQLRDFIVKSYIGAQMLIDMYKDYKTLLINFKRSAYLAGKTQDESDIFRAKQDEKFLEIYTESLKKYHDLVKSQIQVLIELLKKNTKTV